jgi:hypothetical protein
LKLPVLDFKVGFMEAVAPFLSAGDVAGLIVFLLLLGDIMLISLSVFKSTLAQIYLGVITVEVEVIVG